MWTTEKRGRYDRSRLRYPSDLTDEEWNFRFKIKCAHRAMPRESPKLSPRQIGLPKPPTESNIGNGWKELLQTEILDFLEYPNKKILISRGGGMPGSEIPQTEATSALNPGPSPMIADLRTQLVSLGHTKTLLAKSETMTMHIHCYAPKGGENGMHAHIEEEHSFVCLQGEALFRGLEGELPVLKRNQTIFLPRGCFYSFSNESDTPCILLRIGAGSQGYSDARLDPRGQPIPGRAHKAGAVLPVFIEGQFFE